MKASKRQFLVKVAGIEGYFMTKTGGNITAEVNKVYDGGSKTPDVISSPPQADDVVLTRGYDPYRDGPILTQLRGQVGKYRSTVSVTPTDEDLVAIADDASVYPDALLTGLDDSEVDAGSGDAATYQLTFSIGSWK